MRTESTLKPPRFKSAQLAALFILFWGNIWLAGQVPQRLLRVAWAERPFCSFGSQGQQPLCTLHKGG